MNIAHIEINLFAPEDPGHEGPLHVVCLTADVLCHATYSDISYTTQYIMNKYNL